MTIADFIRFNRPEIDQVICEAVGTNRQAIPIDDDERESWVLNDENLYRWAQSEGVEV